jgi:hypothetical protein
VVEKKKRENKRSYKETEANCIPVHYYNQKGAWMDREISENSFNKHFVPEVWAFLKERGSPLKAVLLLDSAPSHPRERVLTSNDGLMVVKFLTPNVTAIFSPWTKE